MDRPTGIAFLLSQLGSRAAAGFAERLAPLDLTPAHVGVLRIVGTQPGLSQQALASRLGALPSRVVRLVDELEGRGLVERRRSSTDRRTYELTIAAGAQDRMAAVFAVVRDNDAELVAPLTADERVDLARLLGKVAHSQGLDPEVHPEYGMPRSGPPVGG